MESQLKISRKSWHYRLASRYTTSGYHRKEIAYDICGYTKQVLVGIFNAILIVWCVVFLAVLLGDPLLYLLAWAVTGIAPEMHEVGIVATGITILFVAVFGPIFLVKKGRDAIIAYRDRQYVNYVAPKEPGFLTQAYRAIKQKMCFKLEMVD